MADAVDAESRIAGGLCLTGGAVLTVWAWRAAADGVYEMTPAVLGPTLVSLGIGLLIHARRIALAGINGTTRAYGLAGAAASISLLWLHGFFARPMTHRALWWMETAVPFALAVYWSMPSRWLGGAAYDPLAPPPTSAKG